MPVTPSGAVGSLQPSIEELGLRIFTAIDGATAPLFSAEGVYARLMDRAMRNEAFKTQLFRFVDVVPALTSNAEFVRHMQEYLGDVAAELSPVLKGGLAISGIASGLVAPAVRANITSLARQFIAGATPEDLVVSVRRLHGLGHAATVDLLGEVVITDAEADHYIQRNLAVLDALAAAIPGFGPPCASDLSAGGPLPRLNLSVKISALDARIQTIAPEESVPRLVARLQPILARAAHHGALVNLDMESYAFKDLTLRLFTELLRHPGLAAGPSLGIAIQAYLRDSEADLKALIAEARRLGRKFTVRLVKGAYWDYETILARQRGWPQPVWSRKHESDACFERMTTILLDHADVVSAAFGTHNVRSIAHAAVQAQRRGLDLRAIEFQMLFGMAEPVKRALRSLGFRIREYCPCGDLLPGMAYFVRRLLENTSNEGFLRHTFVDGVARTQLLADPGAVAATIADRAPTPSAPEAAAAFRNEPPLDFTRDNMRREFAIALQEVRSALGRDHPPVIDGRRIKTAAWIDSVNPANPAELVGRAGSATAADADAAVVAAARAQPAWARRPAAERAAILERAAAILRRRRHELAALEVLEVGKPWAEADGDVTEAIDFCVFYAAEMRRLAGEHRNVAVPGESSVTRYRARGVAVVIAPWNFPLAILCGMTVAALVTGNTVVMKPAEQSPVIAARFFEVLLEAGVPAGAIHFLPGPGEEVGARLVAHPQVTLIAFTGSREVGLKIWETAARTAAGQPELKKVICEMGGKNALVVDGGADLDEALPAIIHSAFGFAGQKCSALSRLIVVDSVYERVLERLAGCAATLHVDRPEVAHTHLGPVIDATAHRRLLATIDEGARTAKLLWRGTVPAGEGYFVPPAIFTDVPRDSRLAREEHFGPVLAVFRAADFDEALALANDGEYALTAGLFSRSPAHIARARDELVAGNIYINRGITGALVGRHPFGGFKMSGGGTKAGGTDYLQHFMVPRAIAENVLRRGFAPEVEEA
ncbi:MAG: L-glutamate gamma-semialdehyde dehydrogenase [Opitutaceae bacterium]|nr:L-glutamate gamma-semialdehyde dehydrogenase [Opitutaceae bacterium]